MLIDMVIESGAIFVQGGALKDWIEVEGVHSKILEVIELVENTLKVSSIAP